METVKAIFLSFVALGLISVSSDMSIADELVVTETGNVGIGTNTPGYKTEINGGWLRVSGTNHTSGDTAMRIGVYDTDNTAGITGWWLSQNNDGKFAIHQDAAGDRMTIDGSGNIGIGTPNPSSKLTISTNSIHDGLKLVNDIKWVKIMPSTLGPGSYNGLSREGDSGLIFSGGTINSGSFVIGPWANGAKGIKIASNGNVGLNKLPDTSFALDVNGVIRAGSWTSNSDIRWKDNIKPIADALERVARLRGVNYDWIDKSRGDGQQLGVIAQEVEEVFPEVVHTDSQGYKSVEYSKLVAPLIEAIKELNQRNLILQTEISKLKQEMAVLQTRVEQ